MKDTITWFDMPTTNFERALKFYSTILGKELHVAEFMGKTMAFFPMEGKEGVGGDLIPPDPTFKPSSQGTRVYLNCIGKLDEVIGRVEKAGGKVVQRKVSIGEHGYIAVIEDTEGNHVGLHSS